jgi:hypothetical protein
MSTDGPVPSCSAGSGAASPCPYLRLAWILAGLSVALRVYQYLCNPPVWCDELWLLRNVVGKSFVEQLGPLSDIQAAPPLFLWVERLVWLLCGDGIFALRAFPLLASCLTMLLLVPLGRRCVRPAALPWAVLLLGFSDAILDYTCEVKPYIVDTFLALLIPTLFLATRPWRTWSRVSLFVLLSPLVIFLSYPGVFLYGGVLVASLPELWQRRREPQAWLAYGLLGLTTVTLFLLLLLGPIRAQHTEALNDLWVDYPDWQRPWTVPLWSVLTVCKFLEHVWRPTGAVLLLPAILGAWRLWRRGLREELLVVTTPVALALLAAWAHRFPFESRVVLGATVAFSLLSGEGLAEIVGWLRERPALRRMPAWAAGVAVLTVIFLLPLGRTVSHTVGPRPRLTRETWPETAAAPALKQEALVRTDTRP